MPEEVIQVGLMDYFVSEF